MHCSIVLVAVIFVLYCSSVGGFPLGALLAYNSYAASGLNALSQGENSYYFPAKHDDKPVSTIDCPHPNTTRDAWFQYGGLAIEILGKWKGQGNINIFDQTSGVLLVGPISFTDAWDIKIAKNGTFVWKDYLHDSQIPTGYDLLLKYLVTDEKGKGTVTTCTEAFARVSAPPGAVDFEFDLPHTSGLQATLFNFPDGSTPSACIYRFERQKNGKVIVVMADCTFYPPQAAPGTYLYYHVYMARDKSYDEENDNE